MDNHKSGERPCLNSNEPFETKFFVITGGPGAGKTALLEAVRKFYCHHVAFLPEAAGILFQGGFWRVQSQSGRNAGQRAIYHVQMEMENLVRDEKVWSLGLCDRGTLDGLAYWQGSEKEFFSNLNSDKSTEIKKYEGVIHLVCPDITNGYNYQNPLRRESPQLAKEIDGRIQSIWSSHPNYIRIESSADFLDKVTLASQALKGMTKKYLQEHCREA